jgi:hypothetical protein
MGMFICPDCKQEHPDFLFFCCSRCHPRWTRVHLILIGAVILAAWLYSLAVIAWLLGWLS